MNPAKFSCPLLVVLLSILAALPAPGQQKRSMERDKATQLLKWAPWQPTECGRCAGKKKTDCSTCNGGRKKLPIKCGECRGKKKTDCRDCFGSGKYLDPFKHTACPTCDARGVVLCQLCKAKGHHYHEDGRKGSKCKICKKKGSFKCWVCKGKGHIPLLQPENGDFLTATEAQIKAMMRKLKPLQARAQTYVGTAEKIPKYFREEDYNEIAKDIIAVFPVLKNEPKTARKHGEAGAKHTEFRDAAKIPGTYRRNSMIRMLRLMYAHQSILNSCEHLFKENKKTTERSRSGSQ